MASHRISSVLTMSDQSSALPRLTPAQESTLAVLRRSGEPLVFSEAFINDLRDEANEAFASQALADGDGLGWDPTRVNVHGGAIALGHPIGSSGARVLVTLLHALQERGLRTGLATLCLGGGNAVALSVERV